MFKIEYCFGKQYGNVDVMFRILCDLICKQCKYRFFDSDNKIFFYVRELWKIFGDIKEDEEDVLEFDRLFSVNVFECVSILRNLRCKVNRLVRVKVRS